MLHRADALYETGRSDALLKLKPFDDAEAKVVDHIPGQGRLNSMSQATIIDEVSLNDTVDAELAEREGSRIEIVLFEQVRVFHRPHPSPKTDKGAVAAVREWLRANGVEP